MVNSISLDISKLSEHWNIDPFGESGGEADFESPVTREMVKNALGGELLSFPAQGNDADKIAWFVKNGWKTPLNMDLGVPGMTAHQWPFFSQNEMSKKAEAQRKYVQELAELRERLRGSSCQPNREPAPAPRSSYSSDRYSGGSSRSTRDNIYSEENNSNGWAYGCFYG